ncbi:terpenoid synthase [Ganoderma leucocontextum]|nr:terpenoid synthase [Ganoderma leucocontextum]
MLALLLSLSSALSRMTSFKRARESVIRAELREVVHAFLSRSNYQSPNTPHDLELRAKIAAEIDRWSLDIDPNMVSKMVETSCSYTETAYAHTSPEHRSYIALYTACMLYGEDVGSQDPDAVSEFARRLVRGERQVHPIFDRLADLLKDAHVYWTDVGADAVITGTVDALSATHIEFATSGMRIAPSATRYPWYLRTRAGGGPQYTHFMFMRSWRETAETYLQILPLVTELGTSLRDEEIAGETNNYVHLRAAAEQIPPIEVLRQLTRRIEKVIGDDDELALLWQRYLQSYLEFSIRTPRYRLAELGVSP